ncbi:hypothetical protein CDL15_Pgr008055 [Punica granatum]|uniref:Uncharacterized protein n=1 Tax=Punica granatum TaxID=22663 RepID=A0A218VS54_PUNGR|nr:hypothetical protein CDL15_Pgr008055 [Punica granatum]
MWHVVVGPDMKSAGFQPDSTQTGPVIPDPPIKSDYTPTCLSSSSSSSATASPLLFDLSVFFLFFFDFQNVLELFRDSGILLRKRRGFFSEIRFPEDAGYNNKPIRRIFSHRESDFSGVDEKGFINLKFISSLEAKASEPLSTEHSISVNRQVLRLINDCNNVRELRQIHIQLVKSLSITESVLVNRLLFVCVHQSS